MQNTNTFYMGLTRDNCAALATLEVRDWNSPHEFTASFETLRLVNLDQFKWTEYVQGMIDGLDKGTLYDVCEEKDCAPSDLPQVLADEMQDEPDENLDLSPALYHFDYGDHEYAWRNQCGGQHDLTDELEQPVNRDWCNRVIEFWKKHHLHDLNEAEMAELSAIIKDGGKWRIGEYEHTPGEALVEADGKRLAASGEYDTI